MQKAIDQAVCSIRYFPIALPDELPVHAPYLGRLHYSKAQPATHMHYHDTTELGICREGSGIFYMGNRVFRYAKGDVSVIAPRVVHIAQSDRESISGWQFIDVDLPGLLRQDAPRRPFTGILHPRDCPEAAELIDIALRELERKELQWRQCIRNLMGLLAVTLLRRGEGRFVQAQALPKEMEELSKVILYISNHYDEELTAERLSDIACRSVTAFRRLFVRTMNVTPFEYVYQVRIRAAVNLLRSTSLPVARIAEKVGYQTLSSFNRHFKRITGMPPNKVRSSEELPVEPSPAVQLRKRGNDGEQADGA